MKRYAIGLLLAMASWLTVWADSVPTLLNYQGHLTDNTPQQDPVTATVPMEFKLYGTLAGSDLLWQESWAAVEVVDGIFSVLLGSQGTPIPTSVFSSGSNRYLEVTVMGESLLPRQRLASVPFAQAADTLDDFEGLELEESAEIDADVASHDTNPGAHVDLIASHGHDGLYYTEGEIDAFLPWGDWTIVNDDAGDKLQFVHPDVSQVPTPVVTVQPPTGEGRVGIGTTSPEEKLEVAGAIKIGNTQSATEGTIRYTGADFQGRVGNDWQTLSSNDITRANVQVFGALGDGVTDDSAAILAAIDSLTEGGVVFFPAGHYIMNSQLTFPFWVDEGGTARQKPYKLQGVGAYFEPRVEISQLPQGGSILDLRYNAGPKIATYGTGLLETDAITFADLDMTLDSVPFIYTTNTTLHIHDSAFYGRFPGLGFPSNDAIVLGGTSAVDPGGPDPNGPFQGYATVIRDNFFGRIRRAVYGRVYANGIAFYGNTIWSSCGSDLPNGAAIEIDGDPDGLSPQAASGWYVAGNLIEMVSYPYGIKTRESQRNLFLANNFFDPSEDVLGYYLFEESGKLNYVVAGFHEDHVPFVVDLATGNARSTVLDYHQDRESSFANKMRFLNKFYMEPGQTQPNGPRVISLAGTELTYRLAGENGMIVSYQPDGGSSVDLWQVRDLGGGVIAQELQGTDARIRGGNGSVRVQSSAGSFLELGNVSGQGVRVESGNLRFTNTQVQILTGSGAPTDSAPNGSIYLRSDGGSGTTMYVRESGSWVAK